jgi:hypothetical protein
MHRTIRALAIAGLLVAGISVAPVSAAEPAPTNDSITSPTVVSGLPFIETLDTSGATSESSDPAACSYPDGGADAATVWYSWTAAESGPIGAATWGSNYDTTVYVGTSDGNGGIDVLACNDDTRSLQAAIRFDAVAGETYLIAVGASVFGDGIGGELLFALDVGPVPATAHVELDPAGDFVMGGVFFDGTVSCGSDAGLSHLLIVELVQRSGNRQTAAGTAFLDIEGCPGEDIPFEIEVPEDIGHFHPGAAKAQVLWFACNDFECANDVVDLEVAISSR